MSIKDVAARAGVSTATVSHVINGTRFVREATKEKVRRAMRELDYVPNSVARSLRSQKSKILAFLMPVQEEDSANVFFMIMAQGIQSVLLEEGYNLIISNSRENPDIEQSEIRILNSQFIDGLILATSFMRYETLAPLVQKRSPLVLVDRVPEGIACDSVVADGFQGSYEATSLLIKKGYRRIGLLVGNLALSTIRDRLEGYRAACRDLGFPASAQYIRKGLNGYEEGRREIAALHKKIDAVFITDNVLMLGAMSWLVEQRVRIPEELGIIGFDDYLWAEANTPPLTMVKQPSYRMGQTAARLILKRLSTQGDEQPPAEQIKLPTELVIRASA